MNTPDNPAGCAVLYRRLFSHVLPYKWTFIAALLGMLIVAAGDTSFAWILQPIMDKGFVERDATYIKWIPIVLLAIAFIRAIGDFIDGYCINWVARRVIQDLRQKMFNQLIYAPTGYYDKQSSGGLVSRLTYDVEQVARASSSAFRVLFRDLIKAVFMLTLMFYLSWELSLIFLAIIPIAFVIFKFTSGRFRKISTRIQESVGDITHIAKQAFQGHRLVKIFGAYEHEKETFFHANNINRQQSMKKAAILSASVPILILVMGAGIAAVIWLALLLEIKPGVFTSYLVAMTMIMRPVKNISRVNEVIQTGMAGAESVFKTIDLASEKDEGLIELENISGNVEFSDVSFQYTDQNNTILSNISFKIPAGSTVALVGPSGSGKSTIASTLMRFYSPSSGNILIDEIPLEEIKLSSLRDNAAIVSQEVVLFDDTIRNNITYGKSGEIDEEKLRAASNAAYIDEFANTIDDGMNSMVGESGTRLSGGQRQRIAIARALYKDAPILILDEATSSLDSRSELHIQQAIAQLVKNRTTLVIAHRLSTIENADVILVLDKGEIIERGTHQQLLDKKGHYYHLYNTQYSPVQSDAG